MLLDGCCCGVSLLAAAVVLDAAAAAVVLDAAAGAPDL